MRFNITVLFSLLLLSVTLVSSLPVLPKGAIGEAAGSNSAAAKGRLMADKVFPTHRAFKDLGRNNFKPIDVASERTFSQHAVLRGNPRVPKVSTTSNLAVPTGV